MDVNVGRVDSDVAFEGVEKSFSQIEWNKDEVYILFVWLFVCNCCLSFKPRVLEPRATLVQKCMYRCDIISWLVRLPTLEPRATFEPGPKGLREPKATFEPRVLEPRATIVPKCMYRCDIISWLVRLPTFELRATFEPDYCPV